jgi:DNA replication licensing factor MCM5
MVVIPGIVVSAGKTNVKTTMLLAKCSNCGHEKNIVVAPGFAGASTPRTCDNSRNPGPDKQNCKLDTYRTISEKCVYVDQQVLKLQEMPENIPTGDMPRTCLLHVNRYLTDKANPGNRVKIVGIMSVFNRGGQGSSNQQVKSSVRMSYVRVLGIQSDVYGQGSQSGYAFPSISTVDEENIIQLAKDKNIFKKVSQSIAPAIFGHADIKMAIACLLFGGSPKRLADGMRLRGDINVLLLGDPSTAKSQFLKFVERVAPIAVYTSGKDPQLRVLQPL